MPRNSIKIVDTIKDVSSSGRIDRFWQFKLKYFYEKYRSPKMVIPKRLQIFNQNEIANYFKLKGFEYGNYTSQNDRNNFLPALTIALIDFSKVLGFKNNNVGLNKTIGIAYGARGMGGSASAHFEPNNFMINLTKNSGIGALSHEYGHAIDFFFGYHIERKKGSVSLTNSRSVAKNIIIENKKFPLRHLMGNVLNAIIYDGKNLSPYYKRLEAEKDGYWLRHTELFARAFEVYTNYILSKKGITNKMLTEPKYKNFVYLQGNDFKRVLPHMNKLMQAIRNKVNDKPVKI